MAEEHQQHFVDCNKVCNFHEGNSNRLASIEASGKTALGLLGILLVVLAGVTGYVFTGQADDIKAMNNKQIKHEEVVEEKVNKAIEEVRALKWELSDKMRDIETNQSRIEGSNQRIILYLEALMEENGVTLSPHQRLNGIDNNEYP